MQRQHDRQSGFSLIEILIVLIIIAVLAAIAIPMYLGQRTNAKDAAVKEGVHALQVGLVSYAADHGSLPASGDLAVLKDGYLDPWPTDAFSGGEMAYSSVPSPGSYAYVTDGTTYTLVGWLGSGSFQLPGDAALAEATPSPDPTGFTYVSSDLVSRLLAYYDKTGRWPKSGSSTYKALGLDPNAFDSPIGNVTYQVSGSRIVASAEKGYAITVTDLRGRTRTVKSSGSTLVYDARTDSWYYGSVKSSNKVDISTLAVGAS